MPRHRPTPEQRQSVTIIAGLGATPAMIAGTLGIETETAERVYAKELAAGPDQVKLQAMQELFRAARGNGAGKVMAATRLLDLLTQADDAQSGGAVRPNGKVRVLYHDERIGASGIRDNGVTVSLYDSDGTQVIVCHPDDAKL
jgi:hypothetical protein